MKQLTKEQKIKLIADIQKGLIPALILQVVESSMIFTQSTIHKINGLQFTEDEYDQTIIYLNNLKSIVVEISDSDLVQKLLDE
jgi:hypothetical protein